MEEGDFRFIKDSRKRKQLTIIFDCISELGLWEYLSEYTVQRFVSDSIIDKISWECEKNDTEFTEEEWYGCLRIMCQIARYGWEEYLTK